MTSPSWSVQDAKNKFSAVVEAAQREPQTVTKHGRPAAVVMSAQEYEKLTARHKAPAKSFIEHLLSIPQSDDEEDLFERIPVKPRDVEL